MTRNTKHNRIRTTFFVVCALLVSFAQPLAALTLPAGCSSCGDAALDGADCCCTPAPAPEPDGPLAEGCCATSAPAPSEATQDETRVAPHHECSCRSAPVCPTVPLPLPPVQDIAAARAPARYVADGCATSMETRIVAGGGAVAPGVTRGPAPPGPGNSGTRLHRATMKGTQTLLAFLSVARL